MENLQGGTLALEHHYHLDRRLDAFGLVTIYAGTQDPFELPVQVTVYGGLVEAGADGGVTDRIKASAQRASLLDARGLLAVVDFGEIEQGVPFVIEETVEGPSLAQKMAAKNVFPPRQVLAFVERLADLLETAHSAGLYHGNLKPEWIRFPDEESSLDEAYLGHFGLSPSMRELVQMPQAVLTTDLVEAFPPECFDVAARDQLDADRDEPVGDNPHLSAQADQWALATLAYRLLVGIHPYFDDPVDASEGILRIKTEAPPSLAEMGVDDDIAAVVDRALSPDPDARWSSIAAFYRALQDAIDGPDEKEDSTVTATPSQTESTAHEPTPEKEAVEDSPSAAAVGPKPSGYLLTAALAALLLTNLGWFFFAMADDDNGDAASPTAVEPPPSPEILPSGLQLETVPEDTELFVIRDDEQQESLGFPPLVVTDSLFESSQLHLRLRHDDHLEQSLYISDDESGPTVRLPLIAREPSDDDDGS